MNLEGKNIGFCFTGSFCMFANTLRELEKLSKIKDIKVMVGGAVLTKEYADMIKADAYCKDAMEAVRYAESYFA